MAKDKHHEAVRLALEKEGWLVTDDPLSFSIGDAAFRKTWAQKIVWVQSAVQSGLQ